MLEQKKKILITGGAGFIGYHMAKRLAEESTNEVTLVDNHSRGRRDESWASLTGNDNVRTITGDLTTSEVYDELENEYDAVYHLAAIIGVSNVLSRPCDVLRVNAVSTLKLLETIF